MVCRTNSSACSHSKICTSDFYNEVQFRQGEDGGAATEAIRRGREESKFHPLEVLGVISPWNPLSTLSFHQENSAIAEGLVLLGGGILESSELGVLCFGCRPSVLARPRVGFVLSRAQPHNIYSCQKFFIYVKIMTCYSYPDKTWIRSQWGCLQERTGALCLGIRIF